MKKSPKVLNAMAKGYRHKFQLENHDNTQKNIRHRNKSAWWHRYVALIHIGATRPRDSAQIELSRIGKCHR